MPLHDDEPTPQPDGGEPASEGGKVKASDVLNRYGQTADSVFKMAELLADAENKLYRLRETNRELRAKVPADGAVLMTPEDAAALESYRALGTPDALKGAQDAAQQASTKLATYERERTAHAAASAHEWKPSVLAKLPSLQGKDIEARDADGAPAYFVEGTPLLDYVTAHDAEFLPALQAAPAAPTAQPYPRQSAGGRAPDMAQQFLDQKQARNAALPNPLAPKQGV